MLGMMSDVTPLEIQTYLKKRGQSFSIHTSRPILSEPSLAVLCQHCKWGSFWVLNDDVMDTRPRHQWKCPICGNHTDMFIVDWNEELYRHTSETHRTLVFHSRTGSINEYSVAYQTDLVEAAISIVCGNNVEDFLQKE